MAGGFDFLHIKAKQEASTLLDEVERIKSNLKNYSDRIDEIRMKITSKVYDAVCSIEKSFEDGDEVNDDGDIDISAKRVLSIFKEDVAEERRLCEIHDGMVPNFNSLVKNYRIASKRVELFKFLNASGYSTNVNFQKEILNLTQSTVGMDKRERTDAVGKLMSFLEDNSDEMPKFMREYVEVWVTENSGS